MISNLVVITIVKNPGTLIKSTLKSLYGQSNISFKHIIFDGGSTDNWNFDIDWDQYKSTTVIDERDEGLYDGLNKAIKYVPKDAIFTFLHAGDIIINNTYLKDCFAIFNANKNLDLLYSDIQFHNSKNKVIRIFNSGNYSQSKLQNGWAPAHTSLVIKKSFYDKVGEHNTAYKISGDYDWMLRAFLNNPEVEYKKVYSVSMLAGGISTAGLTSARVKFVEDLKAVKSLPLKGLLTVMGKRIRKLCQVRVNYIK